LTNVTFLTTTYFAKAQCVLCVLKLPLNERERLILFHVAAKSWIGVQSKLHIKWMQYKTKTNNWKQILSL